MLLFLERFSDDETAPNDFGVDIHPRVLRVPGSVKSRKGGVKWAQGTGRQRLGESLRLCETQAIRYAGVWRAAVGDRRCRYRERRV